MAEKPPVRVTIIPTMHYRDAAAMIDWLERAFGFKRHMVVPGPDGTIAHAEMSFGNGMVMLGSARGADWPVRTAPELGGISQSAYVVIEDPDAHYARAKAAGAVIVRELTDTDYGSRDYSARDPEGQLWNFGTYDPFAATG